MSLGEVVSRKDLAGKAAANTDTILVLLQRVVEQAGTVGGGVDLVVIWPARNSTSPLT